MKTEETGQQPRPISLGLRKPGNLEGNIIYVQISSKDETCSAEAFSNLPFNSRYKSIFGHYIYIKGTRATSRDFGADGKRFIEMLVQDNNGVKEYRLITDAYHIWDEFK